MVILIEATMENYLLGNLIGKLAFDDTKDIMGIIICIVGLFSNETLKLIKTVPMFVIKSLVPSHEPLDWLIFLINVTGNPAFNVVCVTKDRSKQEIGDLKFIYLEMT